MYVDVLGRMLTIDSNGSTYGSAAAKIDRNE